MLYKSATGVKCGISDGRDQLLVIDAEIVRELALCRLRAKLEAVK